MAGSTGFERGQAHDLFDTHEPATLLSYDLEDLLVADASQCAFRRFLNIALRLCNAGSAGLSLLQRNATGQAIIRWEAVSAALSSHEGAESPRDSSPCGECLDAATTTVLSDPQHAFPCLSATWPTISQDLIVPLYDELENPVGTFSQLSGRVVLRTTIEPVMLEAETAIPLASLANEAATNAYKHAFTDGRTGEISLTLHRTAEAALVLQISDNGIGLKANTVGSTLGLGLINAFTAQLGGKLVFGKPPKGSGTRLTPTIPAAAVQTPPA